MIIDLPSTSTSAVNKALVDLRDSGGAVALGRVLTLCVVTDDAHAEDAIEAANEASREHPCRVLVLARGNRRGAARLDAQIRVGGDAGASEVVVLRLYGPLVDHGETTVVPLLLSDAPIVAWWVGAAPEDLQSDPIGAIAQRRITDSAETSNPARSLEHRRAHYRAGDTDLAWTRLTNWRALLAAALDQPPYEPVTQVTVAGAPDSPSTELLAAWLAVKLKAPVVRARTKKGTGVQSVRLDRKSGAVELIRPDQTVATLTQPGQPERRIALARRPVKDCLTEELRRLDPDEVYGETLVHGLPAVGGRTMSVAQAQAQGRISPPADAARSQAAAQKESSRISRAMKRAQPVDAEQHSRSSAVPNNAVAANAPDGNPPQDQGTQAVRRARAGAAAKEASAARAAPAARTAAKRAAGKKAASASTPGPLTTEAPAPQDAPPAAGTTKRATAKKATAKTATATKTAATGTAPRRSTARGAGAAKGASA
ncbi:glucose-6-phosphate dehydrogenase assembly protein OpcA [Kineococcus rubinsiae]|uniref:glucose-6-phosphate dehydrogenase assembly protein OpcA n=1 Tax=Kineococcus rubinsiae TaxID=2609562 RepID=UPI0014311257|nr:glucose-6-phosphate dehydrogenase assembly protein OpcA [Kineococcus rubinsiae]NIZ89973.1 glucose-6-phosphate dehydrogenase assembly protein OpcA [Kineococcus rubinsiae]